VVDDDIAEISAVKRVLARAGHDAVLATNSADAMVALDQQRPDLLLVSSECEGGEALTLARALRDNTATGDIPLMILGEADPLPRGARTISRPIDPEVLTAELEAILALPGGFSLDLEEPGPASTPDRAGAAKGPAAKAAPPGAGAPAAEPPKAGAARPAATPPRPGAVRPPAAKAPTPSGPPHAAVAIGRMQSSSTAHPGSGAGLSDAAASRRAAAEALRARAEELRRSSKRPATPEAPATRATPAGQAPPKPAPARAAPVKPAPARPAAPAPPAPPADAAPPGDSVPRPSPVLIAPIAAGSPGASASESLDLGDLDSTLRKAEAAEEGGRKEASPAPRPAGSEARKADQPEARQPTAQEDRHREADEALRALEEETGGRTASRSRAWDRGEAPPSSGDSERPAAPENPAAAEERALQDAIQTARREAFEAAKRELQEQARKEVAEAARLIQAEARGRQEAIAAAEREARDLAHREAEARERATAAAREIESLRSQLDEERRRGEERVATVMQRAAEEEEAAEESSRSHAVEEQKLRDAISSARSEMDALRRKHQEEARRREEVEYALRRMEGTRGERTGSPEEPAGEADPVFTPPAFFAPFDGAEPTPDPGEEAARRRVAALRDAEGPGEDAPAAPGGDGIAMEGIDGLLAPEEPSRILSQPPPPLRAGDLVELPAPRLLAMALRARLEGRLDFRGETARSLWFEDGRVVGASSADPSERVEEVALRLGLVTRDQHRQIAQAAASLPTRRAAMLLLERGFLKATELTALVRRRTEEVVFGVFADAEARFRWMADEVPPEERTGLERGTLALAVEGVRRRWLAPRLDALLGGPATLLSPVPGAPAAAELGLSADERRVVGVADGLRALEEILQASPLDGLSTRQVLAALVLVGALTIRSLQAGRPPGHAVAAIDLARVREKLEQVRRADYFTVLGVGRLCTPHEVRDAAQRLASEFDPRRFPQDDEGLPGRLAEILQVVNDAREVLANERLRDEYLRGLGDGG
jgi:CheY-like chemotaxis protein